MITPSDDTMLVQLLTIRQQIIDCREQGLHLTATTLRHKAMSLAECFVDPAWNGEQTTISPELRRACREMAAERVRNIPF